MSQLAQRLIMAAGGAKKDDSTYVEDVFSTYLYQGNDDYINVANGVKLGNANAGASVNFADYGSLVVPTSADFKFGTGAFTIEFFIYFIYSTNYISIFDGRPVGTNGNQTTMNMYAGGQLNWYDLTNNTAVIAPTGSTALPTNAWTHVAYVKEGTGTNQAKLYFNGSLVGTGTDPQDYAVDQLNRIGGQPWSPGIGRFSISNYRVVKGTALYTSNFTTPTVPLTNISGTVLLCCQSSTDPFAATVTPGTITIGAQTNARTPVAQSFGTETATDGKGGLVWIKNRDTNGYGHFLFDTKRGTTNAICSNLTNTQFTEAKGVTSFNNGGFNIGGSGGDAAFNSNSIDYASWTYAIQEGFFDIQTWDGNNTAGRQLPHNLGSVPGCIMVKSTDGGSGDWMVYHREIGATHRIKLNSPTSSNTTASWNDVVPTSTYVELGSNTGVNASGRSYVGYFFAGGASTAATARSVYFQAGAEYLESSSSDYVLGTGDFTVELWFKTNDHGAIQRLFDKRTASNTSGGVLSIWQEHLYWHIDGSNGPIIGSGSCKIRRGQWYHAAVVRHSSTTKLYLNGEHVGTLSNDTTNYDTSAVRLGEAYNGGYGLNGNISNFRIVVGTALYTSSFKPPTEPLTSITNTKLLCCNNSSVTGKTTGATITVSGNVTASSDAPFDDSEGFKFGAGEDQNLIKTGSYVGNQNADGPEVYLGWEPQFIILKPTSGSENWGMWDSMRGIVTGGNDMRLLPNTTHEELTNFDGLSLTPTGFKITSSNHLINPDGTGVVYIAIRRSDGYVGKPAKMGSDVFAMDNGSGTTAASSDPTFTSGFPVDWGLRRMPTGGSGLDAIFISYTRLLGLNYLQTINPNVQSTSSRAKWDLMTGFNHTDDSSYQAWMWKRGAGFDAVTYTGTGDNSNSGPNSTSQIVAHSLGKSPEMIWVKCRSTGYNWYVYHSGQNGGTNPWNYYLRLNHADAEQESVAPYTNAAWNNTAPTSTHFSLGPGNDINANNDTYIALLFASVDGISKCGYYDGSADEQTITTGFQPKFVIIKNRTNTGNNWTTGWFTFDTRRGWASGQNDKRLRLNDNADQTTENWTHPIATGFVLNAESGNQLNNNGEGYIYYAHA